MSSSEMQIYMHTYIHKCTKNHTSNIRVTFEDNIYVKILNYYTFSWLWKGFSTLYRVAQCTLLISKDYLN